MNALAIRDSSKPTSRPSSKAGHGPDPASKAQLIRLLLVDDHEVVRLGLRALFNRTGTVQVVGEAGTVESAVAEGLEYVESQGHRDILPVPALRAHAGSRSQHGRVSLKSAGTANIFTAKGKTFPPAALPVAI